jgi:hypothetical protein
MIRKSIKAKQPKCKNCKSVFTLSRPGQKVCGLDCAQALAVSARLKAERVEAKREAYVTRQKIQELKSIGTLKAEAQTAFNVFIRARDADLPCICCDKFPIQTGMRGGEYDAGHYRSRGSADHLRFNEDNVHKQLKNCNRYASGNITGYRQGLIKKIGLERLEALESNNKGIKWNKEMLIEIKKTYQAKLKELLKGVN